jgi:ADP-heptose:LPS heptosyltransferase
MRRILILQTARMGDLVQTLPLLQRLRQEHPQARLSLLARDPFAQLLLQKGFVDHLFLVPDPLWNPLADPTSPNPPPPPQLPSDSLPDAPFDLLVNLSTNRAAAFLAEQIPAARKWGRLPAPEGELRLLGPWTKTIFALVTDRWSNLFNLVDLHLGIAGLNPSPQAPALLPSPEERARGEALLARFGRRPGRKLVALQTGASDLSRAWSATHFSALAQALQRQIDADILLIGSPNERARSEEVAAPLARPPLNLVGETSLPELLPVLAQCDLLISNDTGPIHLAAACATPTLGLYFSTAYYAETAPYGENQTILQVEIPCAPCSTLHPCPQQRCREPLSPEPVTAAALWILSGASATEAPPPAADLSLYRSQFTADGTLLYLPVHPDKASPQFLTGLARRLLWGPSLGLPPNPALHPFLARWKNHPLFQEILARDAALFGHLSPLLQRGFRASEQLQSEFSNPRRTLPKIQALHQELTRVESELLQIAETGGAYGAMLRYEFMDLPFEPFPQLAETLKLKYQSLRRRNDSLQTALQSLPA